MYWEAIDVCRCQNTAKTTKQAAATPATMAMRLRPSLRTSMMSAVNSITMSSGSAVKRKIAPTRVTTAAASGRSAASSATANTTAKAAHQSGKKTFSVEPWAKSHGYIAKDMSRARSERRREKPANKAASASAESSSDHRTTQSAVGPIADHIWNTYGRRMYSGVGHRPIILPSLTHCPFARESFDAA